MRPQTDRKADNTGKTKRIDTRPRLKSTVPTLEVDFDRLVSSIENSIMVDQDRGPVGISPKELLFKSNPAMYSFERDLTNPRDMYSILSHNTKSTENHSAMCKQEIAKNIQASGVLPKITRAKSMNEIKRLHHGKSEKLGCFKSASELNPNRNLNVLVVMRHPTNLEDYRTITEEDKENLHELNLPNITRNVISQDGKNIVNDKNQNLLLDLPALLAGQNAVNVRPDVKDADDSVGSGQTKGKHLIPNNHKSSDPKIDKWFSEMPNEVFDKAQRAIMEASIKDKLTKYQHRRHKKENFPARVNVLHGNRLRKVPSTFLEVRVDSFGKCFKNDLVMNKYKLQQKSIHKLKMRELNETERQVKYDHDDIERSPRLHLQYRSHTMMTQMTKSASREEMQKQDVAFQDDKGLKIFNVNEVLKRDIISRERTHVNSYQDYTERMHFSKSAHHATVLNDYNDSDRDTFPKQCSLITKESETGGFINKTSGADREEAKAAVVNIALETRDATKANDNMHKEKNILNVKGKYKVIKDNKAEHADKTDAVTIEIDNQTTDNVEGIVTKYESSECITKIPTAKSARTSDSNRSTISSKQSFKPDKSVLRRFNMLEVFAEQHGKTTDVKMTRKHYHGHKLKGHEANQTTFPPTYKLDLKQYPQHLKTSKPDESFINTDVRKQELIFRFEPGEVFITRKSNPNRASERARIIYGKVLNKDDRVSVGRDGDAKHSKQYSSAHSLSTRLDGYKCEIGNFEHRALADSITSDAVPEHEHSNLHISNHVGVETECVDRPDLETASCVTQTPQELYIIDGKLMRDIAVETDIIGSETGTPRDILNNDDSKVAQRPESSLSDYIVENNDGESLNSESEQEDINTAFCMRQSRTALKSRGTQSNLSV